MILDQHSKSEVAAVTAGVLFLAISLHYLGDSTHFMLVYLLSQIAVASLIGTAWAALFICRIRHRNIICATMFFLAPTFSYSLVGMESAAAYWTLSFFCSAMIWAVPYFSAWLDRLDGPHRGTSKSFKEAFLLRKYDPNPLFYSHIRFKTEYGGGMWLRNTAEERDLFSKAMRVGSWRDQHGKLNVFWHEGFNRFTRKAEYIYIGAMK